MASKGTVTTLPSSDPFANLPQLPPLPGSASQHHGDGFFGTLLHLPGKIIDDGKQMVTGIIPGIIETGKAVGSDIGGVFHGDVNFDRSRRIGAAVLNSVVEDFQHPLRRPLNTMLDIWGIASGGVGLAARGALAADAVRAGSGAADVAKALLKAPAPEARTLTAGDMSVTAGTYSRNQIVKVGQKRLDVVRAANPDTRIGLRTQREIVGAKNAKMTYEFPQKLERASANEIRMLGRRLTPPQQMALRLYAENVPVEQRLAFHDLMLSGLDRLAARNTKQAQAAMKAAGAYVHTVDGKVEWLPGSEKLQEVYGKMQHVVDKHEKRLVAHGLMTAEGLVTRVNAPGRYTSGAEMLTPEKATRIISENQKLLEQTDREVARQTQLLSDTRAGTRGVRSAEAQFEKAGTRAKKLYTGSRSRLSAESAAAVAASKAAVLEARIRTLDPLIQRYWELERTVNTKTPEVQASLQRMELAPNAQRFADAEAAVGAKARAVTAAQEDVATAPRGQIGAAKKRLAAAQKEMRAAEKERAAALAERERLLRDLPKKTAAQQAEYERLKSVVTDYENLLIRFQSVYMKQLFHEAEAKAAKAGDTATARQILDDAAQRLKIERDAQQAMIIQQKARLQSLAGDRVYRQDAIGWAEKNKGKIVGGGPFTQGRMYVPYENKQAVAAIYRIAGLGARGTVGIPKGRGWLKPFKGSSLRNASGYGRPTELVAQRAHDGVRFIALVKFRNDIIALSRDVPRYPDGSVMKNPVAIRMDAGKAMTDGVKQILAKVEDGGKKLTAAEKEALGATYGEIVRELFDPKAWKVIDKTLIEPDPSVRWIEREMLGGLDQPSPMVGLDNGAGRFVLRRLDDTNNIAKFVTLYLRPATLVPNFLSNIAMNLIQQGFLAPVNLTKSFRLYWTMTPAARAILDQMIGEGRNAVLRTDRGVMHDATNAAAGLFSTVQDLPFRRSAFLHEARREGIVKIKDVERLLTDPSKRELLFRVQDRANAAIIDYSRLGKFEQAYLKRVVYFYPWLKGASVYSVQFLGEHPLQAAVTGQLGNVGNQATQDQLGALPSWAQGLYQVGSRGGMPLTVSTSGILPFTTAATLAQSAKGLVGGPTPSAADLQGNLSPVASAFIAALTNRSSLGAQLPQDRGFAEQFARQIVENTPAGSLVKKLTQDQTGKAFPVTPLDAILGYLANNAVYARPTDTSVLRRLAAKEGQA